MHTNSDNISAILENGLLDLWYPICPSYFIKKTPISLRRLGKKIVFWRDINKKLYALEDHCPHRGAPLSHGVVLANKLACSYHGMIIDSEGIINSVPSNPGCKLEGLQVVRSFHVIEHSGVVWLYNSAKNIKTPPSLNLPENLTSEEYSFFLCYAEWKNDYRYILDNVMDPMHGIYLHKQSHSMSYGKNFAKFCVRNTKNGFLFEKDDQHNVNFDWTEWADTGIHWIRLEIPYPKTGGPGGNFIIIGSYTPITPQMSSVFHWRCRKITSWQRDIWRFLYKNRLEVRHWQVLEQDRRIIENMEPDANQREHLYQHDIGLIKLRHHLRKLAQKQIKQYGLNQIK